MQLLDRKQALAVLPLWRLGFRAFFLAGAVFALLAIALWALALQGAVSLVAVLDADKEGFLRSTTALVRT